jgi:HNH endonuclease
VVEPILVCPSPGRWLDRIIASVVEDEAGCWVWQRRLNRYGYGVFRFWQDGRKRNTGAHRAAWLAFRSDIPDPLLQIDHLCRNRACANPWHMDLVTNLVNSQRGDHSHKKGRSGRRPGQAQYSCAKHQNDDGRMFTDKRGYQRWVCRICARARSAKHRAA